MAEELLSLVAKVSLDDNSFQKGLKNVQNQAKSVASNMQSVFTGIGNTLKSVGSTLSSVGKTISVGVTAPLVGLGVATAKTAVDFLKLKENTRTAFKVLLGSAEEAEKMLNDLYTFAKKTPFSYDTYLQAGKQLVAMGVAAKDTIPYLDGITNAAIATGAGQDGITTLSEAIGRMSSKGKVQLEELNRMIEMGVPAVKILGNSYGVTEMKIYDMMKKGELLTDEALPKLIDGMNSGTDGVNGMTAAYGGLAGEMKGTLAGALDSLRSKFRNMSVEMWDSEEAYPVLQEVIRSFTKTLEVLPKVFVALTKAVVPVLTKVNEKLQAFGEYLDTADPSKLELIGKAILGLAVAGPILIILGKLTSVLGGLFSTIGSIASLLESIGLTQWLSDTWNSVTQWLSNMWTSITEFSTNLSNVIIEFFTTIGNYISFGFQLIGLIISASWQIITIPFMFIWENCKQYVFDAFNAISGFLSNVWNSILGFPMPILQNIANFFTTTWNNIKNTVTNSVTGVWNVISNIFTTVLNFILSVFNSILNTAVSTWNSIKNSISNAIISVWSTIQSIFNNIKNFISNTWNGVKSTTVSTWNSIKNAITQPIQNAFNAVKNIIDRIKGLFNFSWSLPKLKLPHFKISGSFSLNPPSVPSFGNT